MMIGAVVRGVDEIKLLCSLCKVVVLYEVVVSDVNEDIKLNDCIFDK